MPAWANPIVKLLKSLWGSLRDHTDDRLSHGKIMTTIVVLNCLAVWDIKNIRAEKGLFIDIGPNMLMLLCGCLGIAGVVGTAKVIAARKATDPAAKPDSE